MAEKFPRITIITPSFNQGPYIEETIDSVLGQHYPDLEYIIIDGGSTDKTKEIINRYEKHISYWVSEPDSGQCNAINKGLQLTTGQLVNWLNSDDYLHQNALMTLAEKYIAGKEPDVICGMCRVFESNSNHEIETYRMHLAKSPTQTIINRHINQPSTFYKSSIIKQLGGVNESLDLSFDTELWFRYLLKYGQGKVLLIDELLSHFRWHEESKSGSNLFEPFYDEEKNLHFSIAKQLGFPEYILNEIMDDITDYHYEGGPWDMSHLDKDTLFHYFCRKYYRSLYYKQDYASAKSCINALKTSEYITEKKIRAIVSLLPHAMIDSTRTLSNTRHTYLKADMKRQVNVPYRAAAYLKNVLPVRKKIDNSIPVIINNRNRLTFLQILLDWLQEHGFQNIHIIDNNSGFGPLLDFYRKASHNIIHLNRNVGHMALWKTHTFQKFRSDYFIYTDSDVVPVNSCPGNYLDTIRELFEKYPEKQKIGLGIKIDDLPDHFENKEAVIKWEKKYWNTELEKDVYDAPVDTTFAVYRPGTKGGHRIPSLRTGGKLMIQHLPWYIDSRDLSMEEKYYIQHSSGSSSWYHRQEIYSDE